MIDFLKREVFFIAVAAILILGLTGCKRDITISNPDLQTVKDGSYTGEYEAGPVKVKALVSVTNHTIITVKILEHRTGLGKKAETLTNIIVEKQSLNVDIVSGATLSSKVILKAVESALLQGTNQEDI